MPLDFIVRIGIVVGCCDYCLDAVLLLLFSFRLFFFFCCCFCFIRLFVPSIFQQIAVSNNPVCVRPAKEITIIFMQWQLSSFRIFPVRQFSTQHTDAGVCRWVGCDCVWVCVCWCDNIHCADKWPAILLVDKTMFVVSNAFENVSVAIVLEKWTKPR